ncbi:UDP-N-acetylmuramate dehydrogenase [Candidatus Saccharibacteria bacterium]|nr:UDP-N-acetylmuramate dehydrogenase [Candidatus Saccharibacteria bacterium]
MNIHTNIALKSFTTMRLGGMADVMVELKSLEDITSLYTQAAERQLPVYILGSGSNVIARDEGYRGIVALNRIMGFEIVQEDEMSVTIRVGAGENWDEFCAKTVEMGLSGIAAMSAIPGTCGASPVQNIGAYGQEAADVIVSVEAYDTTSGQFVELSAEDCKFSYRHSIFRGEAAGKYCITAVTFRLYRGMPQPPFYDALQNYLDSQNITLYTPQVIRDAVTAIRAKKLPDPAIQPNTGSFFKNSVVEKWLYDEVATKFPDVPHYDMPDGQIKIPTGWLIEQTGLKGQLLHGMRINPANALVLINESAGSYSDLAAAREEIITQVRDMFRITIEQEPLELV